MYEKGFIIEPLLKHLRNSPFLLMNGDFAYKLQKIKI